MSLSVYDHAMIPGNDWAERQSADRPAPSCFPNWHLSLSFTGNFSSSQGWLGSSCFTLSPAVSLGTEGSGGTTNLQPDCLNGHAGFLSWKLIVVSISDA